MLGLLLLRPRLALWTTVGGMSLALLISAVLGAQGWWWSPMASVLGIMFGYLIWNWRRLSVVLAYFGWELARLDAEPKVFLNVVVLRTPAAIVCRGRSWPWNKP